MKRLYYIYFILLSLLIVLPLSNCGNEPTTDINLDSDYQKIVGDQPNSIPYVIDTKIIFDGEKISDIYVSDVVDTFIDSKIYYYYNNNSLNDQYLIVDTAVKFPLKNIISLNFIGYSHPVNSHTSYNDIVIEKLRNNFLYVDYTDTYITTVLINDVSASHKVYEEKTISFYGERSKILIGEKKKPDSASDYNKLVYINYNETNPVNGINAVLQYQLFDTQYSSNFKKYHIYVDTNYIENTILTYADIANYTLVQETDVTYIISYDIDYPSFEKKKMFFYGETYTILIGKQSYFTNNSIKYNKLIAINDNDNNPVDGVNKIIQYSQSNSNFSPLCYRYYINVDTDYVINSILTYSDINNYQLIQDTGIVAINLDDYDTLSKVDLISYDTLNVYIDSAITTINILSKPFNVSNISNLLMSDTLIKLKLIDNLSYNFIKPKNVNIYDTLNTYDIYNLDYDAFNDSDILINNAVNDTVLIINYSDTADDYFIYKNQIQRYELIGSFLYNDTNPDTYMFFEYFDDDAEDTYYIFENSSNKTGLRLYEKYLINSISDTIINYLSYTSIIHSDSNTIQKSRADNKYYLIEY